MTNLLAWLPSGPELWVVLLVIVVLFGGKKIPELMRGVGRGVGELKKGLDETKSTLEQTIEQEADKAQVVESKK